MIVSHESRNYAVLTDGKKTRVIRYDELHLRKYSELLLYPNWTMGRVLKEFCDDLAFEIGMEFPDEPSVFIEGVLDGIMPYVLANIHDPRERRN